MTGNGWRMKKYKNTKDTKNTKNTKVKIITVICSTVVAICLVMVVVFGFPRHHSSQDICWYTRGGIVDVIAYSDNYCYGLLILQDKTITRKDGSRSSQVIWWVRWEWFKR